MPNESIIYFGDIVFLSFIYIVIFLCTKELYNICKEKEYYLNIIWLYSIYVLMYISHYVDFSLTAIKPTVISLLFMLFIYPIFNGSKKSLPSISITLFAFAWIALFLDSAVHLRSMENGRNIIYTIFLSVWMCDSAAYIFGKKFGKSKILPSISPNKTWVGTFSGFAFSTILLYILVYIDFMKFNSYAFTFYDVLIMGIMVGVLGQLGDFFESMIKREFNIKDSGTLLQGHGGVLDRFDSLLFVLPAFYIYFQNIL